LNELMKQSTAEFDKQNYGGALYLANQAKSSAATARGQLASVDRGSLRPGEVPFELPLELQTTSRANVREGPGASFKVLFTLPGGAPVTGQSFADQWVRVTDDSGRRGWVYRSLIGRRP
jgi:SH3-like domain-containing protein